MQYRKLGRTGLNVSVLGFGCMRLPIINEKESQINEIGATELVRYAIDNGVNYIDTAYPYHKGNSERFLAKALSDGYREKVYLATKLPSWLVDNKEDMDKYLDEQLVRLNTDYIDCYLLHSLNKNSWRNLKKHGVFDFLEKALSKGKIKYIGFSFHDDLKLFKQITESYKWDFCQIQYNFMDENYQAGREGLEYAAHKGLGVIVMEPLRGGLLAKNIPTEIQEIWNQAETKRTAAEWALRFVWDKPEVSLLLSGMNTLEQVKENINVASSAPVNHLTLKEKELIKDVRDEYTSRVKVNCTDCKYCLPCPSGVKIPQNFSHLNSAYMYGNKASAKRSYTAFIRWGGKASNCNECGKCEKLCPQQLPIRDRLKEVVEIMGK